MISTARIGTTLLFKADDLTVKHISYDDSITTKSLVTFSGTIADWNGSVLLCNYPVTGAFFVSQPIKLPESGFLTALTYSGTGLVTSAHPKNGLVFDLDQSSDVFGGHGYQRGLLVYGDASVAWFAFTQTEPLSQNVLDAPGCLSRYSWAGGESAGFWIGADKNLWAVQEKQAKKIGFGYLFNSYSRAFLSFVKQTGDLFITLDTKTSGTLSGAVTYLFNGGLSQLSEVVLHACYVPVKGLVGLNEDGDLITINLPQVEATVEYDWDDWAYTAHPTRDPDLTTEWCDFGSGLVKTLSGVECTITPQHPIYVTVEAVLPPDGTVYERDTVITAINPVGELSIQGTRFRFNFWWPSYADAGAFRVSGFRAHVSGDDLRGIYAAASGQFA